VSSLLISSQISCTEAEYSYRTVRVLQGVDVEHAPRTREEVISTIPAGKGKGKFQLANPGSYAMVDNWLPVVAKGVKGVEVSFYMQCWLPQAGHVQTLVSTLDARLNSGFAAVISEDGGLELWVGTGDEIEVVKVGFYVDKKRWVRVNARVEGKSVVISAVPLALFAAPGSLPFNVSKTLKGVMKLSADSKVLLFGAGYAVSATKSTSRPTSFFNGRLDSPSIKTTDNPSIQLVQFDFSLCMSSDTIIDVSGNGLNGKLVNAPTRAIKGYNWDGTESDWTKAKYGYGAIHFHEDDLDDASWETDFTIEVPDDARSGVYAVELQSGDERDSIPFFVRPSKKAWEQRVNKVAFVISTFTYLAYANEQLHDHNRLSGVDVGPGFNIDQIARTKNFEKMQRRKDLGLSNYDVHNDESGVVYSSAKRPILNMRPNYIMWASNRPRELSADLMLINFLEKENILYEVITDHDLHEKGVMAISGFNTVITGCHPEYPSVESYNAYTAYAKQGGNLMYLGGNGFYWVSSTDIEKTPHQLEVRRGDQGVRSYTLPGGEQVHSTNGQQGSLWRSRGRACNVLFGVGFCAEGVAPGVPYQRSEISKSDQSVAWIFEGIEEDELIGVNGLGGGASGDEIDRFDLNNESPACVKVLASSTGHSNEFGIVPEDTTFPILNTLGTQTDLIRSDITYYVSSGGGGIFSVGSINWMSSLGWDDYHNNVARLTGNVVKGFLSNLR
jgi:hypothetical protein